MFIALFLIANSGFSAYAGKPSAIRRFCSAILTSAIFGLERTNYQAPRLSENATEVSANIWIEPFNPVTGTLPVYALVVGGYSSGADIAPELKAKGFTHIIHVHPETSIAPVLAPSFSPRPYEAIFTFTGDTVGLLSQLKKYNIKAIFAGSETSVELADQLSETFGLPGNGTKLSEARRNKWTMHQQLKKMGVAAIHDIKTNSLDKVLKWIESPQGNNGRYPVVLKPLDSAGTQGVHICFDKAQVIKAFNSLMGSKNVFEKEIKTLLAQEFLDGTEYVVNTVSQNGNHVVAEIWKYNKQKVAREDGSFSNIYLFDELLAFDSEEAKKLLPYAEQVLNALAIKQGPGHLEIMLTSRGPVLVEMGARLMGGHPYLAVRAATGTSALDLTMLSYLWPDQFQKVFHSKGVERKKFVRNIQLISHQTGKISKINHLNVIESLPSFFHRDMRGIGDHVEETIDLATSSGIIWLVHESEEVIQKDYERIRKEIEPTLFDVE